MKNGKTVGVSTYTGYTYNERAMISLAVVDNQHSEAGTEVTLVWGEEGRGSSKPTVERHKQARNPRDCCSCPLRRGCTCRLSAALSRHCIRREFDGIHFHEDDLPKLVSAVPGRERTFFVNKELTKIDDMLAGVMHYVKGGFFALSSA